MLWTLENPWRGTGFTPACSPGAPCAGNEGEMAPPLREDASPLARIISPLSIERAWSNCAPLLDSGKCLKPQEMTLGPNGILRERLTAWDSTGKPYVTSQICRAVYGHVTQGTCWADPALSNRLCPSINSVRPEGEDL